MSPETSEPESQSNGIGPKDRINVLLKEYDTLRSEILNRINHRWQMLGLIGVIVTFVSAQADTILSRRFIAVYVAVIVLFALWLRSGQYLEALSVRVAEIEKNVNELAGESLLQWQTRLWNRPLQRLLRKWYRS